MSRVAIGLGLALLTACAVQPKQTQTLLASEGARSKVLRHVPFADQQVGECGPSALGMAMLAAGQSVSVEQLAPQVMTQGKGGSLPSDIISAARRNGMTAVEVEGLQAIVQRLITIIRSSSCKTLDFLGGHVGILRWRSVTTFTAKRSFCIQVTKLFGPNL